MSHPLPVHPTFASCACASQRLRCTLGTAPRTLSVKEFPLSTLDSGYTPKQAERLQQIFERLVEARRELDALIGDAYLRPRASIVPVHFLDLAAAVEKLRWAEKEWREIEETNARREDSQLEDPRVGVDELVSADSSSR
ncbi:MAG TPA: hypothetical protein VNP73_05215 [Actinomycetota bacterium]|nr:hypothetical protein [Actinomycetota bacterium]